MIGTLIFRFGAPALGLALPLVLAAEVQLTGDSKLSGELIAMDQQGTITLVTPFSDTPLQVRSEKVASVDFGSKDADLSNVPSQRIHLINGDILPASIEFLDENTLEIVSPFLGRISVPRASVDSIQLGIFPQKSVYRLPGNLSGWDGVEENSGNFKTRGTGIVFTGQGELSRKVDLPEKFIIRFDLSWTDQPNFLFTFADPLKRRGERADRYILEFGIGGLEIKRESEGRTRITPIAMVNRRANQFPGDRVRIEVKVDRSKGVMHLYVNNELEGRYSDSVPDIPESGGISIMSKVGRGDEQTVENLEVLVWDDRGDRHRAESRGKGDEDSMIGRYGERFGGKLISIKDSAEGKVFLFKSDFQEAPLPLPEEEVSTVFFKNGNDGSAATDNLGGMVLRLQGRGEISAESCTFGEKTVSIRHELLGEVELVRDGVTLMERREATKAKPAN